MQKYPIVIKHIERVEDLNNRIYNRNIPSAEIQPCINTRPVSTKYSVMPIMDIRTEPTVKLNKSVPYNTRETFNPGSARGPWSGFSANINHESTLRNQYFAIQNCEKSVYVPSSNSDLYHVNVGGRNESQPFTDLFNKPDLGSFNPNTFNVGRNLFANNTRQQIKDV